MCTCLAIALGPVDRNYAISAVEAPEDLVNGGLEHEEQEQQVDGYGSE
jgi:hypothetical protein